LVLLVSLLIVGCVYQGGDISPAERKFSWFSYLNGDDIRSSCAGSQEAQGIQARFVYNGVYTEQVRTYDLSYGSASAPILTARVMGPADLSEWFAAEAGDLLAPWAGNVARTTLRDQDLDQLKRALSSDGVLKAEKAGLELSSDDFYWLVSYCQGDSFHYAAYRWPSEAFKGLAFAKLLAAWDMTDIAFNPPRQTFLTEGHPKGLPVRTKFNLRAENNGLLGVSPLFK